MAELHPPRDDERSGRATKKCPKCANMIWAEATRCEFCGHDEERARQATFWQIVAALILAVIIFAVVLAWLNSTV